MPPRHLLAIRREGMLASKPTLSDTLNIFADVISQKISVSDFAGSSPETVVQGLQGVVKSTSTSLSTILVAPFHSVGRLGEDKVRCLTERDRVFPHLDLDHIGETVEVGWKDGLSLGIYSLRTRCLEEVENQLRPPVDMKSSTYNMAKTIVPGCSRRGSQSSQRRENRSTHSVREIGVGNRRSELR